MDSHTTTSVMPTDGLKDAIADLRNRREEIRKQRAALFAEQLELEFVERLLCKLSGIDVLLELIPSAE